MRLAQCGRYEDVYEYKMKAETWETDTSRASAVQLYLP